VTVTVTGPAVAKVQESVDVPDPPVTVAGVSAQAVLSEAKATLAVKPFKGDIVIVDTPAEPTITVTADGLAEIEKSAGTVTV